MERAWAAGLAAIVEVGVDSATSVQARDLARADARVHAVAGLHPHEASRMDVERPPLEELLRAGAASGELCAVGEIGLDFYRDLSPREEQLRSLRWQLDLARELALPVVIHSREADEECYAELATWAARVGRYLGADREIGMMHCFAGNTGARAALRRSGAAALRPRHRSPTPATSAAARWRAKCRSRLCSSRPTVRT